MNDDSNNSSNNNNNKVNAGDFGNLKVVKYKLS